MLCKRNDPACSQKRPANRTIVWKLTGQKFQVCSNCKEAILKRSQRLGGNWSGS